MSGGTKDTVVLIPKPLRAEWMDAIALDAKVSHAAFRVAGIIGSHFNSRTGKAFLRQDTIAGIMGASERTVWTAVKDLERTGYLLVQRRQIGSVTRCRKDGTTFEVAIAGAKGAANTYLPAFESSQVTATNTGSKLAAHCEQYWAQSSQKPASKLATDCEPTLTSPSEKYPSRAREPSATASLGSLGAELEKRIAPELILAWFKGARLVELSDVVTIEVPKRYAAVRIMRDFEREIIEAARQQAPQCDRVIVRAEA